jgi:small subunit ribosomal protein S16
MVKIRLRRTGAKKQPHYRVVVADSHSPRDGRFIEIIGHYNPRTEPPTFEIDAERALYWLGVGAQPTEAVRRMLDRLGIISRAEAIKRGEVAAREVVKKAKPVDVEILEAEPEEAEAFEFEVEGELSDEELEAVEADWEEEEFEEDEFEDEIEDEELEE